jgi:iron-sulfur cluster repair protein YtfE (RIC family)
MVSRVTGRRGAKEVAQLTAQLCTAADAVRGSMCAHMRREEAAVFPLLQQHLCVAEQRAMVRTYRQTQMMYMDNPAACR